MGSEVQILSPRPFLIKECLLTILLTNDDGIFSRGLHSLFHALKVLGRVIVVAPDRERSTISHAITLDRPLRIKKEGDDLYAVDGTPADCVNLAINGLLGKRPDFVVSGINLGENLGHDVLYSGTVSAAFEGTLLGVPSIAVSLVARDNFNFEAACEVTVKLIKIIEKYGLPEDTLLNVNVPNLPIKEIKGVKVTRQGKRIYKDAVIEKVDPRGKKYYWIGGDMPGYLEEEGTDFEAVNNGYVSITPLHLDLTNYKALDIIEKWKI